ARNSPVRIQPTTFSALTPSCSATCGGVNHLRMVELGGIASLLRWSLWPAISDAHAEPSQLSLGVGSGLVIAGLNGFFELGGAVQRPICWWRRKSVRHGGPRGWDFSVESPGCRPFCRQKTVE